MNFSLQSRLLIAATFILAAFLGITGLVLDNAFHSSSLTALNERLQVHIYSLLAAAELNPEQQLELSKNLPDPRFATASSGLYAAIRDKTKEIWRSNSSIGIDVDFNFKSDTGERQFHKIELDNGTSLLALSHGVEWEISDSSSKSFIFYVAEDMQTLDSQIQQFRKSLWTWLGAAGILLLAAQVIILRWSLNPLRRVEADLEKIEDGETQQLTGNYPEELQGLTSNLNSLIIKTQTHLERYRNTLGNLAHSLKTPMAVLRGAADAENNSDALRKIIKEQIQRMDKHVDYQLQRASTAGASTLPVSLAVKPVIKKVTNALNKVYIEKNIHCEISVSGDIEFSGDEGDFLEIIGNLADNAFKFCDNKVRISASNNSSKEGKNRLILTVEDDGPGIPQDMFKKLLERGQRGDEQTDGQGIGLAMVNEIVNIYKGSLDISPGTLGGTMIAVTI